MDREERATARVDERLSRAGLRFDTREDFDTARRLLVEVYGVLIDAEAKLADQESAADAAATLDSLKINSLEAKLDACERELERWRHGNTIEGDFVCPNDLARINAEREREEAKEKIEVLRRDNMFLDSARVEALEERNRAREKATQEAYFREQEQEGMDVLREDARALAQALKWALQYGDFDVAVDNPLHGRALDKAREALARPGVRRLWEEK